MGLLNTNLSYSHVSNLRLIAHLIICEGRYSSNPISERFHGNALLAYTTSLGIMEGALFKYGTKQANIAFISGKHPRHVIAVGGLTCGLMYSEYLKPLARRLDEAGWSLVQLLMSSSHQGYGTYGVRRDAEELYDLSRVLKRRYCSECIVILGHSTGCQDAVMYARHHKDKEFAATLSGVVLQGPVSDREYFGSYPECQERLQKARKMIEEGRGKEIAFRMTEMDGAPMTAQRWLDLVSRNGEDDMFSSDFSDEELQEKLSALQGVSTCVMMSGADECQVPLGIRPDAVGARLVDAIGPTATLCVIQDGSHDLGEHSDEAAAEIVKFVKSLN